MSGHACSTALRKALPDRFLNPRDLSGPAGAEEAPEPVEGGHELSKWFFPYFRSADNGEWFAGI